MVRGPSSILICVNDLLSMIQDDVNEDMAYGIENARIVVVFLSEPYFNSKNCKKELNYADILDKKGFHSTVIFPSG